MRSDNRLNDQMRTITITPDFLENPLGSVVVEFGKTKVLCTASVEEGIPKWLKGGESVSGWLTAEYSMLPCAGGERTQRESSRGKIGGRTHEIQRLIGRSFRAVCDLELLGERTIWIDCDVLQADGGTRTASITGGYVALELAINKLLKQRVLDNSPIMERVAAVSVGIVDGELVLDLNYTEDSSAEVDMNVVMSESGKLVEIQGTAESRPFSKKKCMEMIDLAYKGIKHIMDIQKKVLAGRA